MHTPYGATESLLVATISATEVLSETAAQTAIGRGTCVGKKFNGIDWRVIDIHDSEFNDISETVELDRGQIGELIVRGNVVTSHYVTHEQETRLHKIKDADSFWHRMGDVGYLDDENRFWFCGRKAHRVELTDQTVFTIPSEAIINQHQRVYRCAIVGVDNLGIQEAALIVECWPEHQVQSRKDEQQLLEELRDLASSNTLTTCLKHFLIRDALPVDIRHNAKIFREKLAVWAKEKLGL